MYGVMTLDEVSLLCYQMTTNNAINKNIASVINSWSNSSKCLWTNKVIYIYVFAWSNELSMPPLQSDNFSKCVI